MEQNTSTRSTSKRKRVDDLTEAPVAATTRSSVWFDDGNIVIQAEDTIFKVHKSVLALHSPVFKDMLSVPQPPQEGEIMIEGCPVVRVSDSSVDVTIILEALCQRGHAISADLEPLSVEVVTAFLRLGRKYDISMLRDDATKRLYKEYTASLKEYDTFIPWTLIKPTDYVNIDVINLARDEGLVSLLPVAFYSYITDTRDPKELVAGFPRSDGTIAKLSPEDVTTCLVAYHSLSKLQAETTHAWVVAPAEIYNSCTSRRSCLTVRMQLMREAFLSAKEIDGLDEFQDCANVKPADTLCATCRAKAKVIYDEGRVKFWDGLPGAFGLPDWDQLRKERE